MSNITEVVNHTINNFYL